MATTLTKPAELHWQDALCPACQTLGGIRYSLDSARRLHTARCVRCNWTLTGILGKHHRELMWRRTMGESIDDLLLVLATQAAPVADVPVVYTERHQGTYKRRVAPPKDETPAARLLRLGEQGRLNGVVLTPRKGYIEATSQRTDEETHTPASIYVIARRNGVWGCNCPACGPGCAHLAGLFLHYSDQLADPDVELPAVARAEMARALAEIAHLFGVPVATECLHDPIIAQDSPNQIGSEVAA